MQQTSTKYSTTHWHLIAVAHIGLGFDMCHKFDVLINALATGN